MWRKVRWRYQRRREGGGERRREGPVVANDLPLRPEGNIVVALTRYAEVTRKAAASIVPVPHQIHLAVRATASSTPHTRVGVVLCHLICVQWMAEDRITNDFTEAPASLALVAVALQPAHACQTAAHVALITNL